MVELDESWMSPERMSTPPLHFRVEYWPWGWRSPFILEIRSSDLGAEGHPFILELSTDLGAEGHPFILELSTDLGTEGHPSF